MVIVKGSWTDDVVAKPWVGPNILSAWQHRNGKAVCQLRNLQTLLLPVLFCKAAAVKQIGEFWHVAVRRNSSWIVRQAEP